MGKLTTLVAEVRTIPRPFLPLRSTPTKLSFGPTRRRIDRRPGLVPKREQFPKFRIEKRRISILRPQKFYIENAAPVLPAGIPVWIRNSFAPEKLGTKITQKGKSIAAR